ncbi:1-deoxy-D-xylulose-5-phosphate reductoisomerase [Reinekea thalattae]|uniref:1-deoxy-D-xylulose 5-phosphate reductoisomerase n=1 Tax=Reinekea thalattae TaxID=2593301 RepID=A0A5C8ZA85_9GAMM|nr:1-deoxy-D-xylulose-5-phosphate reductoisomerase [Reinekea thalattae]TXR54078.1 1-deoxy-D-xylulose-5-phosphate reductoisomerase [Reinekea thalattae]
MKVQHVAVLGATGSIGQNSLDVIASHPDRYRVHSLSGFSNMALLAREVDRFKPRVAVVPTQKAEQELKRLLSCSVDVLVGEQALVDIASHSDVDIVIAAIVGAAGLRSSLAAAKAGKRLLLANKESLVVAGSLFMDEVKRSGTELLPIDSEHNAILQCLPVSQQLSSVKSILLTASGGPFREFTQQQLEAVTPAQAIAHPNWPMGRKISVDSASLMNKGLELIEACWLFDVQPSDIEVVVHPQSVIHSMVRYLDGSVIAQLGAPDMRTPIAYGLAYPERIHSGSDDLSFDALLNLTFDRPDEQRFPCLRLAKEAFSVGGTLPAVLNAANEVAVAAFLEKKISFVQIPVINEETMHQMISTRVESLDQLIEVDAEARQLAAELIGVRS